MAIEKQKTMSNGSVGNYWRITSINIDRQNLRIAGAIALFKDKVASDAGAPPMGEHKTFRFPFTMSEFLAAPNAVAFVYGKIKAMAAQTISVDLHGNPIDPPRAVDADLVGGIDV